MARPVSIQNEAILEAARKVFLRHGYKANTKQVAREAGVSEGSLFKHFKTKTDLFLSAMGDEGSTAAWEDKLKQTAGTGDLRANLEAVGLQILEHIQITLPRIMMIRSSGIMLAAHHKRNYSGVPHPIRRLYAVANYFRAEVKKGRLVMYNPEVQAQIFLGAIVQYVFQKLVFDYRSVPSDVYIRTVVDMILKASARPGGRRRGQPK